MQNSRLIELGISALEAEKAKIEQELAELRNHTKARTTTPQQPTLIVTKPRRKMSAAARRK